MDHRGPIARAELDMQSRDVNHDLAELAKLWDCVFIVVGLRGTEILGRVDVFVEDEVPPRVKPWHELSEKISSLEDQNGVALCLVAFKEYEPGQVQVTWRPCLDFTGDPWAERAFEFFVSDFIARQTEKGRKIQNLSPENLQ